MTQWARELRAREIRNIANKLSNDAHVIVQACNCFGIDGNLLATSLQATVTTAVTLTVRWKDAAVDDPILGFIPNLNHDKGIYKAWYPDVLNPEIRTARK